MLVLFGDGPDGPDLLFTQRSDGLRLHAGQPAFPGGAIDAGDGGPVGAALREAAEEVGLDLAGVDVVGTLPEVFIERTGFRVVPVLAWWRDSVRGGAGRRGGGGGGGTRQRGRTGRSGHPPDAADAEPAAAVRRSGSAGC